MKADRRFKVIQDVEGGQWRSFQVAKCARCSSEERVSDATRNGAPNELMEQKFRQRSWHIGSRRGDEECPACLNKAKVKHEPRIVQVVEKPTTAREAATMGQSQKAAEVSADAPRAPTREDRRRIIDALDEHYLPAKACYAKAFTDAALAEKLKLPRAWVAEERDRAFGPDANEVKAEAVGRIDALEKRVRAAEEQGLAAAQVAETARLDLTKLRAEIGM